MPTPVSRPVHRSFLRAERGRVDQATLSPSADLLYRISRLPEASLAHIAIPLVLRAHFEHERNVILTTDQGPIVKAVDIRAGTPVACDSNQPHEWLGRVLRAHGMASEADITACLRDASHGDLPLGEILVSRGLVPREDLDRFLRKSLAAKLLDLFRRPEGHLNVYPGMISPADGPHLSMPQLILLGATRFTSNETVLAHVKHVTHRKVAALPYPFEHRLHLQLDSDQQQLLDTLREGPLLFIELVRAFRLPFHQTARMIYGLSMVGLIGLEEEMERAVEEFDFEEPKLAAVGGELGPRPVP